MKIISLEKNNIANSFVMKVDILPPLFVFTKINLMEIFTIKNPSIQMTSIRFDANTNQLTLYANFLRDFIN
jgi:hypothetical protein